jgi:hypothetical protein
MIKAAAADNEGPTAPSNPFAYMKWRDTSTSPTVLRVRNSSNTGWVTFFSQINRGGVESVSTDTDVDFDHRNSLFVASDELTLNLDAAADVGEGFTIYVKADGGAVTLDPESAELIDGSATYVVPVGGWVVVFCDGLAWYVLGSTFPLTASQAANPASTVFGTVSGELLRESSGIIGRAMASNNSALTITDNIPFDGTAPQITEGYELITLDYTPKVVGTKIMVDFNAPVINASAGPVTAALFIGGASDAVQMSFISSGDTFTNPLTFRYEYTVVSLSSVTFAVRIGRDSGTCYINRTQNTASLAGVPRAILDLQELRL